MAVVAAWSSAFCAALFLLLKRSTGSILHGRLTFRVKAFTLIELLLTFAVIAVLAALLIPVTSQMNAYAARVKSASNLRQIGVAARLYANDHAQQLPGHPCKSGSPGVLPDQGPKLFSAYLSPSDPRVFLNPADPSTGQLPPAAVISNQVNNTGFIYNGFDELGTGHQAPAAVSLSQIEQPATVALMGLKVVGASPFCVDLLLVPISDLADLVETNAFEGGAHYLFVDGSIRFLAQADYTSAIWQVDKTLPLPPPPRP